MFSFDRRLTGIIAGLSALLVGLALWWFWPVRGFAPARPALLYLVAAPEGHTQVWRRDLETAHAVQIAQLPGFVVEYAALPHTAQVIYPVERAAGGHDLWLVDVARQRARLWLDCAPADCRAPTAAPDGRRIVYTRIAAGQPTLWQFALDAQAPTPLLADAITGQYAAWSPDGARLAAVDPAGQVCIVNLTDLTDTFCVPALMDAPPVWSPDGRALLLTDLRLEAGASNYLLRLDVTLGLLLDLSAAAGVEDDAPAWSPDGQWIAFRRKAAGTAMGKQLWLMRADGSVARSLTADIAAHYGPPVWLDDETLAASRHTPERREIWLFSTTVESATLLIAEGYLPVPLDRR